MTTTNIIDELTVRSAFWQMKLHSVTPDRLREWVDKIYSSAVIEEAIRRFESGWEGETIIIEETP